MKAILLRHGWRILTAALLAVAIMLLGINIGISMGDSEDDGDEPAISDADHDRLLSTCVDELGSASGCATWIAELVEQANADGTTYAELSSELEATYEEAPSPADDSEPVCRSWSYREGDEFMPGRMTCTQWG